MVGACSAILHAHTELVLAWTRTAVNNPQHWEISYMWTYAQTGCLKQQTQFYLPMNHSRQGPRACAQLTCKTCALLSRHERAKAIVVKGLLRTLHLRAGRFLLTIPIPVTTTSAVCMSVLSEGCVFQRLA